MEEKENNINSENDENKVEEEEKSNYDFLLKELSEYGYSEDNLLSQSELNLFLERKSPKNKYDFNLSQKLCTILNLTEFSVITISQFISGFLQLYEEFLKKREELNEEYLSQKKLYDDIINMCKRYQSEKLNEEGFSENAKLTGEIIDSNYNLDLEGINEIILKIIYSGQEQEIKRSVRKEQKDEKEEENKTFEFKASSKKDHLQFVLMTKNYLNYAAEIGSKTYSLEGLTNQDSFFVKVEIPFEENENDNEENFAAIIKAKLSLRWSDFEYYEIQKKKEEPKLKKLISDLEEVEEYITKMEYILSKKIGEKNEEEKEEKRNKKGLRKKTIEFPEDEFVVEYNNERIDSIINKGIKVDFNNEKLLDKKEEKNEEKKEEVIKEEIEENKEEENIEENNDIKLEQDINYNENGNERLDINYNNNENIEDNKDPNLIQENNNIELNVDEILKNSQNEQINFENTVNINPQQNFTSYTGPVLTQSTNKTLIQESTLPLKYLPPKVNKVIIDNNVSTLPLIDAGKQVTYFSENENSNNLGAFP